MGLFALAEDSSRESASLESVEIPGDLFELFVYFEGLGSADAEFVGDPLVCAVFGAQFECLCHAFTALLLIAM